jgi:threonine aldolase
MNNRKLQFASDNCSGMCPEALDAVMVANTGHARPYGDDAWTQAAADALRTVFETDCEVFFVYSGTAANSLALAAMCRSYHSVICHEVSHVETDECGGPEFFTHGAKILTVGGGLGKVDPAAAEALITSRSDIHYPKPEVLSVTQPTERGTLYTIDELLRLKDLKEKHGLRLHMDGARLANALESLNVTPAELTWKVGVDVLCLGGTKNGMAMCEAVIFFDRALAREFEYRCKQAGQLASKMRYISAQWVAMLESGAWLRHAASANAMARELASRIPGIRGAGLVYPCQANAVFVDMPERMSEGLHARSWHFYNFIEKGHSRFMCSWNTEIGAIDELVADMRDLEE